MPRPLDPEPLIHPAKFSHVVLRARNLARSIAWYQTVVGMEVVFESPLVAFLSYDAEHHRLALVKTDATQPAPTQGAGLDHFAYSFDSLGDLLRTYRRLKAEKILPVWSINHGPTTSLYYADPDDNRMEFQVDNFSTESELKSFMQSDAFKRNPIGVQFDPEKLARRYEQGHPLRDLLQQRATEDAS